jgi:hypothetical protein
MTDKPKNPPAFPRTASAFAEPTGARIVMDDGAEGMTLRDYFAIRAPLMPKQYFEDSLLLGMPWEQAQSKWSYEYADAMLKARGNV